MLIPITTGCQFYYQNDEKVKLFDHNYKISPEFNSCLKDIYNRFDQDLNGVLESEEVEDLFFYLNFEIEYKEEQLSFYRFTRLIEQYIESMNQNNTNEEIEQKLNEKLKEIDYDNLVSSRYRCLIFTVYS